MCLPQAGFLFSGALRIPRGTGAAADLAREAELDRAAHLFLAMLAYHAVQVIRARLKARDIHLSWDGIRTGRGRGCG